MEKRIFIAINLPEEIISGLKANEKRWKGLRIKWTNAANMHITLQFLGNVNRKDFDAIMLAVGKAVPQIGQFHITLDRIVLGPNSGEPTMFWATLLIDSNLLKLKRTLDESLRSYGYIPEDREFKPHITLARARGNQLKGRKTNIQLKGMRFKVESIEIMQSQLHPGGSKYKIARSFKLATNP